MDREANKQPPYREYSGVSHSEVYTDPDYYNPYEDQPVQTQHAQVETGTTAKDSEYRYDPAVLYGGQSTAPTEDARKGAERPRSEMAKKAVGVGGLLVVIGGWLLKVPGLLFLLKFATPALTALLTTVLYAGIFGWPFAVGLVVSIFIHEMGHAVVMWSKKVPVNGMVFVPFLGAAVFGPRASSAKDQAEIGIAGPVAGGLAASVCLALAYVQPHSLWASLAYLGFFLNLFNLAPIPPLDGAHVMEAIDRRIWILGFVGLLAFQIWMWFQGSYSWWLLLLVVVAATQIRNTSFTAQTEQDREFYNISLGTRIAITLLYFALAVALFMGMHIAQEMIPPL